MTSNTYEIKIDSWSGNVRPYRARVYRDGVYCGETGFCLTPGRARTAAARIIAMDKIGKGGAR